MQLNLSSRNKWYSANSSLDLNCQPETSPFKASYFLFSENCKANFAELLSLEAFSDAEFCYQPLSNKCLWLSLSEPLEITSLNNSNALWELCKAPCRRPTKPALISFDMDSTLIQEEVIDELARDAGCYEEVSGVTEEAMRGELDFNQSLVKRVGLIAGLNVERLKLIAARLKFSTGAKELLKNIHNQGIETAILSGGFDFFAERIASQLGIKIIHANQLEIISGKLSGKVYPPIVNAEMKAINLKNIAMEKQIALSDTIAVGDGANDLAVLSIAGLGVAWHAKPAVAAQADVAINHLGLDVISWMWE